MFEIYTSQVSRPNITQTSPKVQELHLESLSLIQRIGKIALAIFYTLLILPMILNWPMYKQLWQEAYQGVVLIEENPLIESIQQECFLLEKEIDQLRLKLCKIEAVVENNPQFKKGVCERLRRNPNFVATVRPISPFLNPDDIIEKRTKLAQEKNVLLHLIKEAYLFFERNPDLKEMFLDSLQ